LKRGIRQLAEKFGSFPRTKGDYFPMDKLNFTVKSFKPFLVITAIAKVLPSDRAKFAKIGITWVIPKPIQPLTLVAEIMGWSAPA